MYIADYCKFIPYETDKQDSRKVNEGLNMDKLVDSKDPIDRIHAASKGYGLDILINDEDPEVREAVAKQGYSLDILENDKDYKVRLAVAKQGYDLDNFVEDPKNEIRLIVAKHSHGLNVLVNDSCNDIKRELINQGYGLDKFYMDKFLKSNVFDKLSQLGISIFQFRKQYPDKCGLPDDKFISLNNTEDKVKYIRETTIKLIGLGISTYSYEDYTNGESLVESDFKRDIYEKLVEKSFPPYYNGYDLSSLAYFNSNGTIHEQATTDKLKSDFKETCLAIGEERFHQNIRFDRNNITREIYKIICKIIPDIITNLKDLY